MKLKEGSRVIVRRRGTIYTNHVGTILPFADTPYGQNIVQRIKLDAFKHPVYFTNSDLKPYYGGGILNSEELKRIEKLNK